MKARIKWTKTGVLRFIGHLDVQRYFHKAIMRAGLPVSFTKGMSPHQMMSFAAPLGLGMTSEGEYVDVNFDWSYPGEEMLERLNAVMNEGISVTQFRQIHDKEKNCMSVTAAADYLVGFRPGFYHSEAFTKRCSSFFFQETIPILKKTKRSEKEVDISPMILEIREYERKNSIMDILAEIETMDQNENVSEGVIGFEHPFEGPAGPAIYMKLVTGSAENLKPQLVMEAFCNYLGYEYNPFGFTYHRLETYLEKDGILQPLGSVGWDVNKPVLPEEK